MLKRRSFDVGGEIHASARSILQCQVSLAGVQLNRKHVQASKHTCIMTYGIGVIGANLHDSVRPNAP